MVEFDWSDELAEDELMVDSSTSVELEEDVEVEVVEDFSLVSSSFCSVYYGTMTTIFGASIRVNF